ncbi:hypothetical protein TNCV_3504011 [Trichonephila clavipes]|uniref:Uncharacterized protein n=1 Tax=Trichonephila clavipes TaxID=2585209 RepID=A0A8X6RYI9_TRICX|nr:hypothetical protein TNCV_3504011 [Trichonephila clavipes]
MKNLVKWWEKQFKISNRTVVDWNNYMREVYIDSLLKPQQQEIGGPGVIEVDETTQGLLVMDLVILNHGQMTRTSPELAHPSPNFRTTPTGGHLSFNIFNMHPPPAHGHTGLKLMTCQLRVCYLDYQNF